MHEVSLVHSLFDQANRAIAPHPSAAVRLMRVRIGEQAGVEVALFRTAFEGCRADRGYGAAELELSLEPAEWVCHSCGARVLPGEDLRCSSCGDEARLTAGGGIFLDRLELEVVDV